MKKRILLFIITLICPLLLTAENKPKYVFYFIGDGMGFNHVSLAEYYNGYINREKGPKAISFSNFPVLGMATTFSATNLITDSAAAGTALATGEKSKNGAIGVNADCSEELKSIAYKIHEEGYKVGISSTVGLNHATPAAFYGHNCSRSNYYDIALEITESEFEFFGGGGIIDYKGEDNTKKSIYKLLKRDGYEVIFGKEAWNKKGHRGEKVFYTHNKRPEINSLPYAIDRDSSDLTHAEIVRAGIEVLSTGEKGFFFMSEGGRIDWSSHANDTKTTALEVLDFAEAIEVALEFYRQYPDQTLIIVTADHETGGLALGYEKGYNIFLKELDFQQSSTEHISKSEITLVEEASKRAHIGWSTADHSAANVPIFAIGASSELFSGRMDNTDIPKKICQAMGIEF
ncbi:MAG: alkaline phosphatase [Bacteroidales bacterium]|nr:alkaline phosphatase [Bacteroidales bacterium]